MMVYVLHFDSPLHHARHYVGWTKSGRTLKARIERHQNCQGAKIMKACVLNGITFTLARVFKKGDRNFERKLKKTHNTKQYCPICMGAKVRKYKAKESQ